MMFILGDHENNCTVLGSQVIREVWSCDQVMGSDFLWNYAKQTEMMQMFANVVVDVCECCYCFTGVVVKVVQVRGNSSEDS